MFLKKIWTNTPLCKIDMILKVLIQCTTIVLVIQGPTVHTNPIDVPAPAEQADLTPKMETEGVPETLPLTDESKMAEASQSNYSSAAELDVSPSVAGRAEGEAVNRISITISDQGQPPVVLNVENSAPENQPNFNKQSVSISIQREAPISNAENSAQANTNVFGDSSIMVSGQAEAGVSEVENSDKANKDVVDGSSSMISNQGEAPSNVESSAGVSQADDEGPSITDSDQDSTSQKRLERDGDFSREDEITKEVRDSLKDGQKDRNMSPHHKLRENSDLSLITGVKTKMVGAVMEDEDCSLMLRGPFRLLYKQSKYYVDKEGMYTYEEGLAACKRFGLTIADMDDIGDHRVLQRVVASSNPLKKEQKCPTKFYIGLNELQTKGLYKKGHTGKNISYQNFHRSQPDDMDLSKNCVVLSEEIIDGPVGSSNYNCNTTAHLFCMFRPATDCFKESKETAENMKSHLNQGMHLIANLSKKAYYVSNFQLTWTKAMNYCNKKGMILIVLDNVATESFFKDLIDWQRDFTKVPTPPLEYWTAGRMRTTHMNAPIFWHTSSKLLPEEEMLLPHLHEDREPSYNLTFTFSGIYRWTAKKKRDPGAPIMYRRDLCISFAFEGEADPVPVIRATNCEIPCYFLCAQDNKPKVVDYEE